MRLIPFLTLAVLAASAVPAQAQRGPIQVFILAGQSNMEGKGAVSHLLTLASAKETREEFAHLRRGNAWTERGDVWISYDRLRGGRKAGELTVGYGSNDKQIGPELGFGKVVGDGLDRQVLLIKCCWGGASLKKDFLAPGSGGPGPKYTRMIDEVHGVLSNLKRHFPKYGGQRYQLAGFVWFQGWNDSVGGGNPEYTKQLAQFVRDVRKDLSAPNLPFVIGELGQAGRDAKGGAATFRAQQKAVADMAEFAGSVAYVPTGRYVDPRLQELFGIWRKCKDKERRLEKDADAEAKAAAWSEWKAVEEEWNARGSDRPYHYYGSGEVFYRMGAAFGHAMLELRKTAQPGKKMTPKRSVREKADRAAKKDDARAKAPTKKTPARKYVDHIAKRKKLQPKIDDAIDAGIEWLTARQLRDGSWGQRQNAYATGQTALSVYTLLKCGLGPEHKNVRRGLEFIRQHEPDQTYTIGCVLMAYEAADPERYEKQIQHLHRKLCDMQQPDGGWSYRKNGRSDLSNTQYAALGLRAAMLAGVRTPPGVLKKLCTYTANLQKHPEKKVLPPAVVETEAEEYGAREGHVAGFTYLTAGTGGHGRKPTGSMTSAGIGIMAIVRDCYGRKMPRGVKARVQRGIDFGTNWLQLHWSVKNNPGARGWHHYYLYGLERCGALLLKEVLAGHPWYVEGAEVLVNRQEENGSWGAEDSTCFSLLFLQRATWSKTRTSGRRVGRGAHFVDKGAVHLRASGNESMSVWIRGFSDDVKKRFKATPKTSNIRIVKVQYLVNGKVVVKKDGDITHDWRDESYAGLHRFERNGSYKVKARVHVLPPGARRLDADTKVEVLESQPFTVTVQSIRDPMAEHIEEAIRQGLLRDARMQHKASSTKQRSNPRFATDGKEAISWVSGPKDAAPTLTLKLSRAIAARYVLVSPAPGSAANGGLASVEVRLNERKKVFAATPEFGRDALRIDLGKKRQIKHLAITLRKKKPGTHVGIAELYLMK